MCTLCMYPPHVLECAPPNTCLACASPTCTLPVYDWLKLPTTANQITCMCTPHMCLACAPHACLHMHPHMYLASLWLVKAPHHGQSDYLCMHPPSHAHLAHAPSHARLVHAPQTYTLPVYDWLKLLTTANQITSF